MLKNRILWLILTAICCFNVFGQQREITKTQFSATKSEAIKKVDGYNRRVTYKKENFKQSDGSLQSSYTSIFETILPDKTRYLSIQTTDGVTKKYEEIKIGFFQYQKTDDGKWTKIDLRETGQGNGRGRGRGNGFSDGGDIKITNKYTVVEDVLNGQQTLFYEGLQTVEFSSDYITFAREKFWIDKEGLILKSESKSGRLNPERLESLIVTEYEYDPKDLKIKAPIK